MGIKLEVFDSQGEELQVGDSVIMAWRWSPYKGQFKTEYLVHKIELESTPDRPGIQLFLSGCRNGWRGSQVVKVNPEDFSHIPKGQHFIFIDKEPVSTQGLNLTGLSDEEYEKMNREFEKLESKMYWGNNNDNI